MARQPEPVSKAGAHKITAVTGEPRSWTGSGKPMLSYTIGVTDPGGALFSDVELALRADSPAPNVGETLDGIVNRRFFDYQGEEKTALQFKKEARGGGAGGGRAWKPRPDDAPVVYAARQAQIVSQHSQDMALRVLELAQKSGDDPQTIMDRLGVATSSTGGEAGTIGLVDAFRHDASLAAREAWKREAEGKGIASALAALG